VATTGNYSDLINTPALSTVATTGSYTSLLNVPLTFTPSVHAHVEADIGDLAHYTDDSISGLETVFDAWDKDTLDDFSGSFTDLTDIPLTLDLDSTDNFTGSFLDLTDIPLTLDLDSTNNFYGDMGGLPITNVGDPVNPQDAATMAYVDATGGFSGSFNDLTDVPITLDLDSTNNLPVSFNDLTDVPITLDLDSTNNLPVSFNDLTDVPANLDVDATDDFDGIYASLTNAPAQIGYFGGDMQSKVITNLTMPVAPGVGTDAVNRAYVDALEARVATLEGLVGTLISDLAALEARVTLLDGGPPPAP